MGAQHNQSVTEEFAAFVAGLKFEDLPEPVVHEVKRLVLDTIGCGISGFSHERGVISRRVAESFGGAPEATILVSGTKTSSANAAYANANMASALDNEETWMNSGHISSMVVFPAIALGERLCASGKDLITAVAAGYEVAARIGLSTGFLGTIEDGEVKMAEVYGTCSWHGMGAVASSGKMLGLSEQQMGHALGVEGHFAPMPSMSLWLSGYDEPLIKYWDSGWASMGGIWAALLAKQGYTAVENILDGDRGFWRTYGAPNCNFDIMRRGLGKKWWLRELSYKPWPTCRLTHHALTPFVKLIDEHNISPQEVEKVTIKGSYMWTPRFKDPDPKLPANTQFNAPHALAMAIFKIPPGPDWHKPEIVDSPAVRDFRKKVSIEISREVMNQSITTQVSGPTGAIKEIPTTVEIVARGQTFTASTRYAKGDPWSDETIMTDDELKGKFRINSVGVLTCSCHWREQIEQIIDTIFSLEELTDLDHLTRLLSA
ncbi:MmgE/PrpD family protein [Chloroflexota bacterium]